MASVLLPVYCPLNLREHGRITGEAYEELERVYKDKEEVKEMLITAIKKEKQAYFEEGKQAGLEEGIQKGKQEGLQEGIQKGKREGLEEGLYAKSVRVAERMLQKGQEIDFICEVTELSRDEVLKIKKRIEGKV